MIGAHTPGPWSVKQFHPAAIDGAHIVIQDEGGMPVAQAHPINGFAPGLSQVRANAGLIAAAPLMFAALNQIARLSRESDPLLVDVPAMLGDIARVAIQHASVVAK